MFALDQFIWGGEGGLIGFEFGGDRDASYFLEPFVAVYQVGWLIVSSRALRELVNGS